MRMQADLVLFVEAGAAEIAANGVNEEPVSVKL
jgi:hypothetical protein